jgi:hypothetical protein
VEGLIQFHEGDQSTSKPEKSGDDGLVAGVSGDRLIKEKFTSIASPHQATP